jgi:hypothetical protein
LWLSERQNVTLFVSLVPDQNGPEGRGKVLSSA